MTTTSQAETHDLLVGLAGFIESFVIPLEQENGAILGDHNRLYGETGGYSDEAVGLIKQVRRASAEAGYYSMFCPEDLGGGGQGFTPMVAAEEMLHHRYGPGRLLVAQALAHWTSGPSFVGRHMSDTVRSAVMPGLLAGDLSLCFGMSEPDAGSDAWMMRTHAHYDDGQWVINGTKQWISNSPYADFALVFAVTDGEAYRAHVGGVTCFLVPMSKPGVAVDSVIKLFGHVGGNEGILSFDDVRVPPENVVGEIGRGMALALEGLNLGRMYNASRCVGMARWALERATDYAKTRRTFGHPISDYQAVSFALVDSAIDIRAARLMAYDVARRLDSGSAEVRDVAMTKLFCVEACWRTYDRAIQVFGGMGLTNEAGLHEGWHEARLLRIADGSEQILKRTVANRILKGDLSF